MRRGASSLGCLFSLLIVSAVIYFGINVVEVFWRYYEFQDEMTQTVKFDAHDTNDRIATHLRNFADSLGLPDGAGAVNIRRTDSVIAIESYYDDALELPMVVREVHFHPHAEGPL